MRDGREREGRMKPIIVCGLAVLALAGTGVLQARAGGRAPPPPANSRGAPALEELRRATYQGIEEAGDPVTLSGGQWAGPPAVKGSAVAPSVVLVGHFRLTGDLEGDRTEEAVVLLAGSAGGSGENLYLAVVGRRKGRPWNVATALLGDRVQVRDAQVNARRIIVDVLQAGPNDAMCCPGELATRRWTLESGRLKEAPARVTGRLSPEAMGGVEWVLREWYRGEAAPAEPEVTLRLDAGNLAGSAGCNRYFAPVKAGSTPGALSVGMAGSTRMMCPETEMSVETRFLRQLAGVDRMRFTPGRLGLGYERDGRRGIMLFERRAKP
jgi:heat shock protein HslJ